MAKSAEIDKKQLVLIRSFQTKRLEQKVKIPDQTAPTGAV